MKICIIKTQNIQIKDIKNIFQNNLVLQSMKKVLHHRSPKNHLLFILFTLYSN